MEHFRVRPLSEEDIDGIVRAAGGERAHTDEDRRDKPGSDYRLAETLIELKSLDDEGLEKPERQTKLAALFLEHSENRPVVVLDREALPSDAQRSFDRILEGPIKSAVAKARKQLKQSKAEHPDAKCSVLFIINNGYTAIDHETLVRMVAHRVRNDTREIDGVVVAGCYFYSDSFDSYFLWPIEYVPINVGAPFASFQSLKTAWDAFAERFMSSVVTGELKPQTIKGPIVDTDFQYDGVTYVKPAPPMGLPSNFFQHGRPRENSTGLTKCPPVAITFPELSQDEWSSIRQVLDTGEYPFDDFESWQNERSAALTQGELLKPAVLIRTTCGEWEGWCDDEHRAKEGGSVFEYAADQFHKRLRAMIASSNERSTGVIIPSRYVLAVTEEIGQDRANDISHIILIREVPHGDPIAKELVVNARLFHEHAIALAAAYAVAEGVDCVLWQKDLKYAWV